MLRRSLSHLTAHLIGADLADMVRSMLRLIQHQQHDKFFRDNENASAITNLLLATIRFVNRTQYPERHVESYIATRATILFSDANDRTAIDTHPVTCVARALATDLNDTNNDPPDYYDPSVVA